MSSELPALLPGAAPIYLPRAHPVGCVVLHGFTAAPAEVRWLAYALADAGCAAYAPRLAGHGTDPTDLARTTWGDWYASARDAALLLRAAGHTRVLAAGLSMGGLLALLLAAEGLVDGIAVLAAPLAFRGRLLRYIRYLRYFAPYTDQTDRSPLPDKIRAEQMRRGEPMLGRVRYDRWSTAAVGQLVALAGVVRAQVPRVRTPALLLYARRDQTAPFSGGEWLRDSLTAAGNPPDWHVLEWSGHILTQDEERDAVFARVCDFAARFA